MFICEKMSFSFINSLNNLYLFFQGRYSLRTKEVIYIFLVIIVTTSVYIGYQYFKPEYNSFNVQEEETSSVKTNLSSALAGAVSFVFEEPETFEDMIADLESIGSDTIIHWTGGWHGRRSLSYVDALKLARKANWIGVGDNKEIGFIFWLDGDFWIWYKGLQETYTQFEKVEIQSGVCTKDSSGWTIILNVKNTGSASSTINAIFVNDIRIEVYGASGIVEGKTSTDIEDSGTTIQSGQTIQVHIGIANNYKNLTSGTTINIKLHSAGGMDYIKLIELV